jgi:hypothetical protein
VSAIAVTVDSTFIRGCHDGERHLEVRAGNVETSGGGRQVFGAVAKADTEIEVMIRRGLKTVGRAADTELTACTDGAPALRSILSEAGCKQPPIAAWFHIAMRLHHAKQAASGLPIDTPGRTQAMAVIIPEVERLHWRIWKGMAKNAWPTLDRVRNVMHVFQGERGRRTMCLRPASCGARGARLTRTSVSSIRQLGPAGFLRVRNSGSQPRDILENPAIERGMVHLATVLSHRFLELAVADWIGHIPADGPQDDVPFEVTFLELNHRLLVR